MRRSPIYVRDNGRKRGYHQASNFSRLWNRYKNRMLSPEPFGSYESSLDRQPMKQRKRARRSRSKSPTMRRERSFKRSIYEDVEDDWGRIDNRNLTPRSPMFDLGMNESYGRLQQRNLSPRKDCFSPPPRLKDWHKFTVPSLQEPLPRRESRPSLAKCIDQDYHDNRPVAYDCKTYTDFKDGDGFVCYNNYGSSRQMDSRDDASRTTSLRPPSLPESPVPQSSNEHKFSYEDHLPQSNRLASTAFDISEKPSSVCTSCTQDEIAVTWCRDCSQSLCRSCLAAHKFMRIFTNHQVDEMQCIPPHHPGSILGSINSSCRQTCCPQMKGYCNIRHSCCGPTTPEGLWSGMAPVTRR